MATGSRQLRSSTITIVPAARSPKRCSRRVKIIDIRPIIPVGITKAGGTSSATWLTAASGARSANSHSLADLIVRVAEALGAKVDSVVISELTEATYFAQLRLRTKDDELIEIDSRPSDAIAVAVTFSPPLPIYVSEHVLDEATSTL